MCATIIIVGLTAYIIIFSSCPLPSTWVWGVCECGGSGPPGYTIPEILGLPEGIPGFPWEATPLGLLIAVVFVLTIRHRKQ